MQPASTTNHHVRWNCRYDARRQPLFKLIENAQLTGLHDFDSLHAWLYRSMCYVGSFGDSMDTPNGAIFNLEFSLDGKVVVAACERCSFMIYDPATEKLIKEKSGAHDDCINCIHFLDSRTFVTGSDDKTIKLWDLRKSSQSVAVLRGHSGWVKNIGSDKNTGCLISSSFDQTVKVWNLDNFESDGDITSSRTIVNAKNLLRSKLSNSCSKLFLAMTNGAGVVAVHDLDLSRINDDFDGIDICHHVTSSALKRGANRIESITQFPKKAWCIYSIDVHPFDWCIVSRYLSEDDMTEYLAVHDIQDFHLGGCKNDCTHSSSSMTHHIKESKSAKGYIKEVCFSSDGRLICSPFKNGVRLLSFDPNCNELCYCAPEMSAVPLSVVNTIISHKRSVLTSAFSPILPLLVTGCRGGDVHFHFPRF